MTSYKYLVVFLHSFNSFFELGKRWSISWVLLPTPQHNLVSNEQSYYQSQKEKKFAKIIKYINGPIICEDFGTCTSLF